MFGTILSLLTQFVDDHLYLIMNAILTQRSKMSVTYFESIKSLDSSNTSTLVIGYLLNIAKPSSILTLNCGLALHNFK